MHTKKLCVAACADAERQQGVLHLWVLDAATLCCTCSPADASTLMCCYLVSVMQARASFSLAAICNHAQWWYTLWLMADNRQ